MLHNFYRCLPLPPPQPAKWLPEVSVIWGDPGTALPTTHTCSHPRGTQASCAWAHNLLNWQMTWRRIATRTRLNIKHVYSCRSQSEREWQPEFFFNMTADCYTKHSPGVRNKNGIKYLNKNHYLKSEGNNMLPQFQMHKLKKKHPMEETFKKIE